MMPPMSGRGVVPRPGVWGAELGSAVPRTSLGRGRWTVGGEDTALIPEETVAMAQKREVAQRALAAGTRALLYGSAGACACVLLFGRLAAWHYDVRSVADLQALTQRVLAPSADAIRASMEPYKEGLRDRMQAWAGPEDGGGGGGGGGGAAGRFGTELRRTSAFRGAVFGGFGELRQAASRGAGEAGAAAKAKKQQEANRWS